MPELYSRQPLRERNGVTFQYRPVPDGLEVTITKGADRFQTLLEWTFGAGSKAYTPVGRIGGQYFEHRVSWYKDPGRLGLTPGHTAAPSPDAQSAAGVPKTSETITRCFNCHATGVRAGPDLSGMWPGVTCERCHGPGAPHVAAAKAAKPLANTTLRV